MIVCILFPFSAAILNLRLTFPDKELETPKVLSNLLKIRETFYQNNWAAHSGSTYSTKYLLDNIERIFSKDYIPTRTDIFHFRFKPSMGNLTTNLSWQNNNIQLVNISLIQGKLNKWIHYFENAIGLLFCVDLCAYDIPPNNTMSKLQKSFLLWENYSSLKYVDTRMVILFNKIDLFKEKIQTVPFRWTGYDQDPHDWELVLEFVCNRFTEVGTSIHGTYTYFVQVLDTEYVNIVSQALFDILFQRNISCMGFIL
eukprot:TRINITY_DN6108_c0_g1_i2.p1 TRINITY_DN6108_c0_g1~~TRINITY_DN6108_c0_g1_i2.p1  ORF type:complete len:255 (-),score=23.24 TRINITY_DN6108_c0_g1_i2:26-790(-)